MGLVAFVKADSVGRRAGWTKQKDGVLSRREQPHVKQEVIFFLQTMWPGKEVMEKVLLST
jgi:hypothetical protein